MAVVPAIVADAASVGTDASCVGHEFLDSLTTKRRNRGTRRSMGPVYSCPR
jgi:hypothetical protein